MSYIKFRDFMNKFAVKLITWISLLICFTLSLMSLLSTAVFEKGKVETILYKAENIPLLILCAVIILVLLYMAYRLISWNEKTIKILKIVMIVYTILLGAIWVFSTQSLPFADGEIVDQATTKFAHGDFSLIEKGQYFDKFPFQLNLVFVFHLIYQIVGYHNYIALQLLNVLCLAGTYYYMQKTMNLLFKNIVYDGMLMILFILCLPALLYCSFIYSTMYGLFLSTLAFYYGLCYIKTRNYLYFIPVVLAISLAIMLKSNFLITLVALACILIMDFINHKKFSSIVLIILMLIVQGIPTKLIKGYYEDISNMDIGKGIPTIAWIGMGMHEGNKASGWYNSFMFDAYKEAGYDSDITKQFCIQGIKKRLNEFKANPSEFFRFYQRKINSQWNEPTYESLWVSEHRKGMHAIPLSKPIKSLYHGDLHEVYVQYTNTYQFVIVLFSGLGIWFLRKRFTYMQLSLGVLMIGGFLFHMIWEGNSKYILPYFLLLIPYASIGLCNIFNFIKKKETAKC